jgi:CubicO group peptidase (beta-lactamase class C family)
MAENPFTDAAAAKPAALNYPEIAKSNAEIGSGANWFYWIAGLSLVNSVLTHGGSDTSFVIGLGFTLIADNLFKELAVIAYVIDALALAFFIGMGWFAGKGRFWAFVTGMVFYTLDAGIYLMFQDWMPFGFHVLALFYMGRGAMKLREAIKAAQNPAPAAAPPPLAS